MAKKLCSSILGQMISAVRGQNQIQGKDSKPNTEPNSSCCFAVGWPKLNWAEITGWLTRVMSGIWGDIGRKWPHVVVVGCGSWVFGDETSGIQRVCAVKGGNWRENLPSQFGWATTMNFRWWWFGDKGSYQRFWPVAVIRRGNNWSLQIEWKEWLEGNNLDFF